MSPLEEAIIGFAEAELKILQNPPEEWDFMGRLDYTGAYQAAMAYCKLAHTPTSGLTEAGVAQLQEIETRVTAAFISSGVMQ